MQRSPDVIYMVKKSAKILYRYYGHAMDLMNFYGKSKKRRGLTKISVRTLIQLKDGRRVKMYFVYENRKKRMIGTAINRYRFARCSDVVHIYGKRRVIELFFKMAKVNQCRDFDT